MGMRFELIKTQSLNKIDFSRKGSVDKDAVDVVNYINKMDNYFTTSSCSGRVCIFEKCQDATIKKKGSTWLYITHDPFKLSDLTEALKSSKYDATLKYETFILHVQCKELKDAKLLHYIAIESGYRNSGISIGKNDKIIMAVRSTHFLEVPLTKNGDLIVSQQYLEHVVELSNKKMVENLAQIERFFVNLKNTPADKFQPAKKIKTKNKNIESHLKPHKLKQGFNDFVETFDFDLFNVE